MGIVLTLALALVIENRTFTASETTARAIIDVRGEKKVRIRNVTIDGGRDRFERRLTMPRNGTPFIDFYPLNAIAIDRSTDVLIENVRIRNAVHLAIVVARSARVVIRNVIVEDSGSLDERGRNNTTGGILIEEGTTDFEIRGCRLERIRGNAIWTHSYTASPRNARGLIVQNEIDTAGRDAIQIGHSTGVIVANNVARNIGYPAAIVDVENEGYPVGIDTAGNVDSTSYRDNRLFEINGKCFDLDGFHDGNVSCNQCINVRGREAYPHANLAVLFNDSHPESESRNIVLENNTFDGMIFGAVFLYGRGHRIENNRFLNVNRSGFDGDPAYLRAGFYFAPGLLRPNPPRDIILRRNTVSGHRMKERCLLFAEESLRSGVQAAGNECRDMPPPAHGKAPAP